MNRARPIWRSGAALATGEAAGLCGGARAGPAQFRCGAADGLRNERAGAGADRADPAGDHRRVGWATCTRFGDQAGIIQRLVDFSARITAALPRPRRKVAAGRSGRWSRGRPGPAVLECAMDVWGREGAGGAGHGPACRRSKLAGRRATRSAPPPSGWARPSGPLIVGRRRRPGRLAEVTELSRMLQAPVLGYRRGRGVLDGRESVQRARCRSAANCGARPMWCSPSAPACSTRSRSGAPTRTSPSSASTPIPRKPERFAAARRSR